MCCGTVRSVAKEMQLGEKSEDFGPYAAYLNAQAEGQLPSAWSPAGKKLLQDLVGGEPKGTIIPPTEPSQWLEYDWHNRCKGFPEDTLSNKAALLVVQRSDDYLMIPGYDLFNHRNGAWLNTMTQTMEGQHQITTATKTIEKGEQIYISYNQCKECQGRRFGYGTAGKHPTRRTICNSYCL